MISLMAILKKYFLDSDDDVDGFTNKIPIRTLIVMSVKADMSEQIKTYYEQFGPVNSVEVEKQNNSDTFCAFVEFKLADTAASVLSWSELHRIDGCNIQVEAAKPWHQPDHILNALDDDCLRAILSKLNQTDLTNAANVCVRFNQLAKSVFSTKIKKLTLRIDCYDDALRSLETFGSMAQSINIKSDYFSFVDRQRDREHGILCMMIAKCCTSILKELIISNFRCESQLPSYGHLDAVLSKLDRLSFVDCHLRNQVNDLLPFCVDLKVLHFERCRLYSDLIFPINFRGLEELQLIDVVFSDLRFITDFATTNKTLKKLSIHVIEHGSIVCPTYAVATIIQNFPNLVELDHNMNKYLGSFTCRENIRCLGYLKSLKVLKIHLSSNTDTSLFQILTANAIPIEHMQLTDGIIDAESVPDISQMKQLKILKLCDIQGLTDEHMIELAMSLGTQLEKLQLKGCTAKVLTTIGLKRMLTFASKLSLLTLKSQTMVFDVDDYKEILETLKSRPLKIKLTFLFELISEEDQIEIDEKMLIENRDIFDIHAEKFVDNSKSVATLFER